jgi:serine/threonine protein kinase
MCSALCSLYRRLHGVAPFGVPGSPDWYFTRLERGEVREFWTAHAAEVVCPDRAKALLSRMFCINPARRFTIDECFSHAWVKGMIYKESELFNNRAVCNIVIVICYTYLLPHLFPQMDRFYHRKTFALKCYCEKDAAPLIWLLNQLRWLLLWLSPLDQNARLLVSHNQCCKSLQRPHLYSSDLLPVRMTRHRLHFLF